MRVRVVFFDLGDTLVEIAPDVLEDSARQITILTRHPVSVADLKKAERTEWLEWATRPQELLQVETEEQERRFWEQCFYPSVLKRLGVFFYPPHLVQLLTTRAMDPGSFVLFPEVEEVLNELERAGVKLGIISNSFPSAERILCRLNRHIAFPTLFSPTRCTRPNPSGELA